MKIYSWKTLLATILIGGGMFIYELKNAIAGKTSAFFFMMFWIYLIIKGLWVSLTWDGSEMDRRKDTINKRVIRQLFGSWAFIATYGGLLLVILALLSIKLIPSQKWFSFFLFIGGLLYQIVIGILVRKHIKIEERKYF